MENSLRSRALIDAWDPAVNAFVEVLDVEPRGEGPLAGMTLGVKDCFYDRGRTPTMGSRVHPQPSSATASVLERLRGAGADIVGYTNLHEWAIGGTSTVTATGPVHNPWDLSRIAGGSSGGSAAALAAGFVDLAIGTDTGGSIRIPAGCCGITGLKPTQGRIPTTGYVGEGGPTDQIGPMARDVSSVRTLFECLAGEALTQVDAEGLRIGIARGAPFDNISPEVAGPYGSALEIVASLGETRDIYFDDWDALWWANSALFINHTASQVADNLHARPAAFNADALKVLLWGLSLPPEVIAEQVTVRDAARRRWAVMFEDIDVLITPTLPSLPPPIADLKIRLPEDAAHADVSFGRLCGPMNLAGVPCLSMPCGLAGGLAVNLSITAGAGRDEVTLALGAAFEDATDRAFTNRTAELRGAG